MNTPLIPAEWLEKLADKWHERAQSWGGPDGPGALHECEEDLRAMISRAREEACPECEKYPPGFNYRWHRGDGEQNRIGHGQARPIRIAGTEGTVVKRLNALANNAEKAGLSIYGLEWDGVKLAKELRDIAALAARPVEVPKWKGLPDGQQGTSSTPAMSNATMSAMEAKAEAGDVVRKEIDGLMDNARHDCATNRAVAVDRIMAALRPSPSAPSEGGWIPVSERLPDQHVPVQVFLSDDGFTAMVAAYRNEDYWCLSMAPKALTKIDIPVTHWMPLPEPPRTPEPPKEEAGK